MRSLCSICGIAAVFAGLALALIMIPLILRTTEEVILLVPNGYREAALALGVSRWKTIVHIVLSKTDTANEETLNYARRKQLQMERDFRPKVGRVALWEIACRPPGLTVAAKRTTCRSRDV